MGWANTIRGTGLRSAVVVGWLAFTVLLGTACGGTPAAQAPTATQGAPAAPTARAGPLPSLRVAYETPSAANAPVWMALETNAFQRHGVDVKLTFLQPAAAVPALTSNEVDVLITSGPQLVQADLRGLDMVMVAGFASRMVESLFAAPGIKSAQQLKGQVVAGGQPGTPTDYYLRTELQRVGLDPQEVRLLRTGSEDKIYAAMRTGIAKAGTLSAPFSFEAEANGFTRLTDTFSVPYQSLGVVVLRSRLQELTPGLRAFLAGLRDGVQAYDTQPQKAQQVLQKYTKENDPKLLQETYDFYKTTVPFEASLQPTTRGLQGILKFFSATIPAAKTAKPAQFIDTGLLGGGGG